MVRGLGQAVYIRPGLHRKPPGVGPSRPWAVPCDGVGIRLENPRLPGPVCDPIVQGPRTLAFHAGNTGSNPVGVADRASNFPR